MMHGNKKKEKKPLSEEETKGIEEKLAKIKLITEGILRKKNEKDYSEKQLENLLKSSVLMPDFYTLWNYRKDIISSLRAAQPAESFYEFLKSELKSIMPVMLKNPKSYVLWFHRLWVLKMAAEHEEKNGIILEKSTLNGEIGLCSNFLTKDERNFHCWNYRMKIFLLINEFFSKEFPKFLQSELDMTITMIKKNFSNFSAWHYRSKIIPFYYKLNNINFLSDSSLKYFEQDLELITSAIFTAPNEQSCWNYHYWLINNLSPIYIEKVTLENNVISIQFSDIFKVVDSSKVTVYDEEKEVEGYHVESKKSYSNILQINLKDLKWTNVKIQSLPYNAEDKANDFKPNLCFTKQSLVFANISIINKESSITFEFVHSDTEYGKQCHNFLQSQLKTINELIAIEEKDQSFFYEYARFRKAQIETFILFLYHSPLISKDGDQLIASIREQYQKLMSNSKRTKNVYETLYNKFNNLIQI